jgi:nucleotide-binding universal stress UspA family protein
MFAKVLVAIDGSKQADLALDAAVEIARKFRSDLTVLTVVPIRIGYLAGPVVVPPVTEEDLQSYRKILEERTKKIDSSGLKSVRTAELEGYVVDAILSYMEKEPQDLLVVGARGLSATGRLFLGSTSDALVHHAACPVLVFQTGKPGTKATN